MSSHRALRPLALAGAGLGAASAVAGLVVSDDRTGPAGAGVGVALVTAAATVVLALGGSRLLALVMAAASLAVGASAGATVAAPGGAVAALVALAPAAGLVHVALALPRGRASRPGGRRAVRGAWAVVAPVGLALALASVDPGPLPVVAAALGALAVVPLVRGRLPRLSEVERRAVVLAASGAVVAGASALLALTWWVLDGSGRDATGPPTVVVAVCAVIPAAVGATCWPWAVRRADRAAVVAAGAVAVAGAAGIALAVGVLVLGRLPDRAERAVVPPAATAVVAGALVVVVVHRRVSASARALVHGARSSPQEVVRTFTDRASVGTPDEELLTELAVALRTEWRLDGAEVWTGSDDGLVPVASSPRRTRGPVTLTEAERTVLSRAGVVGRSWLELWIPALVHGRGAHAVRAVPACSAGELLGLVVVELPAEAEVRAADDAALGELGRRLGVVLHARRLDAALTETLAELRRANDELRASRARLVAAADAARHRIERDLHDGAQQQLVSLAVTLRLARDAFDDDPADARRLLADLSDDARAAIQQLRDLAHGIYPPLLADAGLPEALRAAATRASQPVRVVADDVGRHPADVEAAVYFCCLEALQNAAKHAPGADVEIRLTERGDVLTFAIRDDGPGFEVASTSVGHGRQHMADRVGAVGGIVSWDAAPGRGTTVRGTVPVGEPPR